MEQRKKQMLKVILLPELLCHGKGATVDWNGLDFPKCPEGFGRPRSDFPNTKHQFSWTRQLKARAHRISSQDNIFKPHWPKFQYELEVPNTTGNSLSVDDRPVLRVTPDTVPHVRIHLAVKRAKTKDDRGADGSLDPHWSPCSISSVLLPYLSSGTADTSVRHSRGA